MAEFRCNLCDRNFKDNDGLEQHNNAKHFVNVAPKKSSGTKYWVLGIFVFIVVGGFVFGSLTGLVSEQNECKTAPAEEQNIGSHTNLAQHIHVDLKIIIDGKEQSIPANIGVLPGIMRPLHTHDGSGEVHIEGPCVRDYALKDFFAIWKKKFNSENILDKSSDNGEIKMFVNGKENNQFENYILLDREEIIIEFKSK